jgi:glycosyltransferase involved in cell wall biosynthesis
MTSNNKINVLYICGAGSFCGATRSLHQNVKKLTEEQSINAYFISASGTAVPLYSQISSGIIISNGLSKFDNTSYSYYRGLRVLILLREIFYLPSTIYSILKSKIIFKDIDIIHINEITNIPTLLVVKLLYNVPIVLHVRSVFRNSISKRSRLILYILRKCTSKVIAIDSNVRNSLNFENVEIIHNSFDIASTEIDFELVKNLKSIKSNSFCVGFIGNLLKSKGIGDLLQAAIILRECKEIKFLILGDETRTLDSPLKIVLNKLNILENPKQELLAKIVKYNLQDNFILLGKSFDLSSFFNSIDILCFPSYLDAPGRPIFEAAFYSIPSIACISRPYSDTFVDNETGILVPEGNFHDLSNAILQFYNNRLLVKKMGENALQLAMRNFSVDINSGKILKLYNQLLNN